MRKKRIKIFLFIVPGFLVCALCLWLLLKGGEQEGISYRETPVQYGSLVVGIKESGAVDIGTVDQVFELDMSALQRADTSGSSGASGSSAASSGSGFGAVGNSVAQSGGMGGNMQSGMDMFNQIFSMAEDSGLNSGSQDSSLTIEQVCVSIGQQVRAGDPLYLLEEESVSELEKELQSNVEKAKADLDAVYAEQELSRQTAEYTFSSSQAYGEYADTEYNAAILDLEYAAEDKRAALEKAERTLAEYEEQLAQTKQDYDAAAEVLKGCEWSRDNTDKWDSTYDYIQYFQMAQTAEATADSLKQKLEQLEDNTRQASENVTACANQLAEAERALELGRLIAAQTLSLRRLAYSNAGETYDIALGYLEEEAAEQEKTYAEAKERWEDFSAHIQGNAVCAAEDGVITDIGLEEGDTLTTNDKLVTLYDQDNVTMTVSVDEDDREQIEVGAKADILLTAYPDQIFSGEVTEIGDAETDSDGNVTYEITATISGKVSGLFQGMTGEITFVTKEAENVLYVSNRAVIREGARSYVRVREEDGGIRRQEIVTGFSDGVNVEILEGLSEGDTALIESKVKEK